MSSSDFDFEDLLDSANRIERDATKFVDGRLRKVNEFGEYEDDEDLEIEGSVDLADEEFTETSQDSQEPTNSPTSQQINEVESAANKRNLISEPQNLLNQTARSANSNNYTWLKNSVLSPTETDKEFELFSCFVRCGGGRTLTYVSQITNLGIDKIKKIATRNNWVQRAADFDRHQLSRRMAEVEGERHKLHLRKLEEYREQQETIGQQLSLSAARIAYLANRKLTNMLDSEQDLDTRDLPSLLNAASKLAEVGKNLQGNALGVDQLLAAIEESDID
jgi:hypothetical protein